LQLQSQEISSEYYHKYI